jgi:NAD(P)-dependent dehydrogenase (short-subunit alcohol dehydrogenase family)
METLTLTSKVAFVTGGARRIGRQIALTLAGAGADVAITYNSSSAEAEETVHMVEDLGRRGFAVPCDVRSEESVRHAVAAAVAFHDHLDLLVNNAGVFQAASLESMSVEQWDEMFQTNARGPFLVSREALPHLREGRGRIIHLGSLGGLRAWPDHAHYCASKAALHMLTQAMAKAFAPEVTVNCVAPGWIQLDDDPGPAAARFAAKTPLGRNGSAEEVAEAVLFFATGPAFITGQILCVDGGLGL